MFNKNFYPTPETVIDQMIEGIQIQGKVILEPSAGSGRIVDRLISEAAKQVLICEKDKDLKKIVEGKGKFLTDDVFNVTSDQISHIDYIIANPPFDECDKHLLHLWNICPPGCKIIALCNYETIKNPYSKTREELKSTIETYGQFQELGDCFSTAERKTDVNVALIRLDKPSNNYDQEFAGFFMDEEPEEQTGPGLMPYNIIRDLVQRYVGSIKIFDQQLETAIQLNEMARGYFDSNKQNLSISITRGGVAVARNEFKKSMQRDGWNWIFDKMDLTKHTTRGLREDINKFVEKQSDIPFTMRNIYHMLDMVIQTTGQRMDKAIIEVFDKIIKHSDDNKYGLPGWKTNSHYLLTKRFIYPYIGNVNAYRYGHNVKEETFTIYSHDCESIADMEKALCYITGENWEEIETLSKSAHDKNYGEWYESHFFKFKGFKKGTVHFEFKSEDVWATFNQRVAKIKGYPLPEKKAQTAYQKRQTYTREAKPAYKPTAQKPIILATFEI